MVEAAAPGQTPGRVGPYRIIRRLGAGGMGVVYLGQDEASGQQAAVKLIRPELAANEDFRARLRREVELLQRVPRFCTAPVLAADTEAQPAWVATEYIEAPTLDVLLVEQGGRLRGAQLEALAVGVLVALRALHEHGVIHRDLKPSNIIMSAVGPRVIDFGIARMEDAAAHLTRTGDLLGTLAYVAPELLEGKPATKAVDVYAWGCVVTLAGSGRLPFGAGDAGLPPALAATAPEVGDLDEPLRSAVLASLAREPAARPSPTVLVDRLMAGAPQVATQVVDAAAVPPTAAVAYPAAPAGMPAFGPYAAPPPASPAAPPGATMPMGQPTYGWQPPGYPPAVLPMERAGGVGGGNRLWLVVLAAVAALALVGVGTTAAFLVLRDRPGAGAQGGGGQADPSTATPSNPPQGDPSPTDPSASPSSVDSPPPPSDSEFNFRLAPTFGTESASSGFSPDPMTVPVSSGGPVDASYLDSGCRGYGAQAPDFRLQWGSEGGLLRFFFVPDGDGEDTGLVVNVPNGSWHCNDDSYGTLNPTVEFTSAATGQYDVWVTTYGSPGEFLPGTLHITELSSVTPGG
jgi:serine/threonine protein kinase